MVCVPYASADLERIAHGNAERVLRLWPGDGLAGVHPAAGPVDP
jgi:hypothetical protein